MNILEKPVSYEVDNTEHAGFVAWKDSSGPAPGVIIIHEWWGLNEYIKERARQVAALGYTAFAIDMYGMGQTGQNPDEAANLMNGILENMDLGSQKLRVAYETLCGMDQVNETRTAAMGYCFGGAMALHMARMGLPLSAVAAFHAALGAFVTAEPGTIKPKILVCHGADDAMVSMDDVASFKQEMDQAQADYEVLVHADAQHGFTNPEADENCKKFGVPLGYQAKADQESWNAMSTLYSSQLG